MTSNQYEFDLNLTDEQTKYVVDRAKETGLFHKLTEEFIGDLTFHLTAEDVPEDTVRELLRLMARTKKSRQKYEDVLMKLGGWPLEEDGHCNWHIPNLYIVAENDTRYFDMDGMHEAAGTDVPVQIYTFHLVDVNYNVHMCSFTGSFELWPMGRVPVTVDEDLDEGQIEGLHRLQDELDYKAPTPEVDYTTTNPAKSGHYVTCRHLGAPEFTLFDHDDDPKEVYHNYMDEMACQLSHEADVRYDLDVTARIREDAMDRLKAEHVGVILTVQCGKDKSPEDQLPDWVANPTETDECRRENGVYTTGPWHCTERDSDNGSDLFSHNLKLVACLDMEQWERLFDDIPLKYDGPTSGALGMPSPDGVEMTMSPALAYTAHKPHSYVEAYVTPYPAARQEPEYDSKPYGSDDWAFTRESFIKDYDI